ncbi:unnamed protein product, partial [marine sediment metagenome]
FQPYHLSTQKYCSQKCQQKAYYKKNKDKIIKQTKKYHDKNKSKINACRKEWYERNKPKIAAQHKAYRKKNKKKLEDRVCLSCGTKFSPSRSDQKYCSIKCACKAWRERNKEHIRLHKKEWYESNRPRIKARYKERYKRNRKKVSRNPLQIYRLFYMRKKYVPIKMTVEEFVNWYNSKPKVCCYCGIPENSLKYLDYIPKKHRMRLQIERINNEKRYELDNIALACRTCNILHLKPFTFKQIR